MNNLTFIRNINTSTNVVVDLLFDNTTQKYVVKKKALNITSAGYIDNEEKILKQLNNNNDEKEKEKENKNKDVHNIAKLYDTTHFDDKGHVLKSGTIFLEYISGGDLLDFIISDKYNETNNAVTIPIYVKLYIIKELLTIVNNLHEKGYCHLDIKPDNVMMDEFANIKLIDFGFAKNDGYNCYGVVGTTGYLAPEIQQYKYYNGYKADIFSAGMTLIAIFMKGEFHSLIKKVSGGKIPSYPLINTYKNEIIDEIIKVYNYPTDFAVKQLDMISQYKDDRPKISDVLKTIDISDKEIQNAKQFILCYIETKNKKL